MTDPAKEMKDFLRNLGQPVLPDAKARVLPPPGPNSQMIVLDRVRQDVTPPYCIHGYASCIRCGEPCWLGHETEKIVSSGEAYAICLDCAHSDIPVGTQSIGRVQDHLRKDGPH